MLGHVALIHQQVADDLAGLIHGLQAWHAVNPHVSRARCIGKDTELRGTRCRGRRRGGRRRAKGRGRVRSGVAHQAAEHRVADGVLHVPQRHAQEQRVAVQGTLGGGHQPGDVVRGQRFAQRPRIARLAVAEATADRITFADDVVGGRRGVSDLCRLQPALASRFEDGVLRAVELREDVIDKVPDVAAVL